MSDDTVGADSSSPLVRAVFPKGGDDSPSRGIAPSVLLTHVRNTIPYLFSDPCPLTSTPYLDCLRGTNEEKVLSHAEYFQMCVSAHFATVGSFVPTDVDNQIRSRLWHRSLPVETVEEMTQTVLEALHWDIREVSSRWVHDPVSLRTLSGHDGEWFSIATAAYGAWRGRDRDRSHRVAGLIFDEIDREAKCFQAFRQAGDGISLLKCAAIIAHNLGDLDRVMDMWSLSEDDFLRRNAYKLGHRGQEDWTEILSLAGELNKAFMATENHRHFALRPAKCLRSSPKLLLPIGPFFDDWGAQVSASLSPEETAQVAGLLIEGWEWLLKQGEGKPTFGYARAVRGIIDRFPGGESGLCRHLPSGNAKLIRAGLFRKLWTGERTRFEDGWVRGALKFVGAKR